MIGSLYIVSVVSTAQALHPHPHMSRDAQRARVDAAKHAISRTMNSAIEGREAGRARCALWKCRARTVSTVTVRPPHRAAAERSACAPPRLTILVNKVIWCGFPRILISYILIISRAAAFAWQKRTTPGATITDQLFYFLCSSPCA